ncbi:hypothetical protein [Actinomadura sp. CNU-125]|uniref:hypothetical protein n=1 Tax=Actinomadura sp. CNU-125 TaxID=1904961 RepID=UPI001177B4B0|nr:hypothetical protein [Actinomadura sp. CNU-125]
MEIFVVVVGAALVLLAVVALGICVRRSRGGDAWDGMQFAAVGNAGIGVFLLAYGLPWNGTLATIVTTVAAVIGFTGGMILSVYFVRSRRNAVK